ncbi:uncharacterized protein [Macrobrachium rosenbergii]|uniref:uncharacterized protein n=1 Tax=Macrobrachium rosenbergii TaxID=79674 RepID=UPI0034D6BF9A
MLPLINAHSYLPLDYQKREADQRGVVEEPPQKLEVVQPEPQQQVQPQDKALQPLKPYFDKYYLLDSVNKIMAALSNYTCTLHKLGIIDEYLNLRATHLISDYGKLPLSDSLKKDLAEGLFYCRDLTYCLPVDKPRSPLPLNLQRLLMAMKCEKETRTNACFKEDLRRNIEGFDLSLFPRDEALDSKVNKLAAIVVGVDSLNELAVI